MTAGDLDLAGAAADDLSRIAAIVQSKALVAAAALAHGGVALARGDTVGARRDHEKAAHP